MGRVGQQTATIKTKNIYPRDFTYIWKAVYADSEEVF